MAKTIIGTVTSKKTDKTIVVTVARAQNAPAVPQAIHREQKFMAHDEKNEAGEGDKVVIVETRPISARKRFKLQQIVQKAGVKHVEAENPLAEITEDHRSPRTQSSQSIES